MSKTEKKLIEFLESNYESILLIVVIVLGLRLRYLGINLQSDDFNEYLKTWYETLKANMGFKGLVMDFYNYYIPYMCVIAIATYFENLDFMLYLKVISVLFELMSAFLGGLCAYDLLKDSKNREIVSKIVFSVMWLSPTVILNGAYWAQCDYIYIAFLMLSVYMLLKDHTDLSFIFLGIAFTFKLQAAFLLPAYALYYLRNKKFSIFKFLYIPVCYIIGGIPAIIEGKTISDTYGIYITQSHGFGQLSMNIPNVYRFFPNEGYQEFYQWGICAVVIIFLVLGFITVYQNYTIDKEVFVLTCAISAGICCMFLPEMHERYSAPFITFSYLYFLIYKGKAIWKVVLLDFIAMITYFYCLYGLDMVEKYRVFAVVDIIILLWMIKYALCLMKGKKRMEVEENVQK